MGHEREKRDKRIYLFLKTNDGGPLFLENGPGLGGRVGSVVAAGVCPERVKSRHKVVSMEIVEYGLVSVWKKRSHTDNAWLESDNLQVLSLSVREQRHRRRNQRVTVGTLVLTFF